MISHLFYYDRIEEIFNNSITYGKKFAIVLEMHLQKSELQKNIETQSILANNRHITRLCAPNFTFLLKLSH